MDPDALELAEPMEAPPTHDADDQADPLAVYGRREAEAAAAANHWQARSSALAQQRMWVFLLAAAALVAYAFGSDARPAITAVGLLAVAFFVVLVVRHGRAKVRERWHSELARVAREARCRRLRHWDGLEQPGRAAAADHAYADDLDVFGHASLYTLLGTTATRPGADTLAAWLLAPATADRVRERQAAVRELTPAIEFRDELHAAGRIAGPVEMEEIAKLLEWAEAPTWLAKERAVGWAAVVLPSATVVTVGLHIAGMAPFLWIVPTGLTLWLVRRYFEHIRADFTRASNGETGLRSYHELIKRIVEQRFEASLLGEHHRSLSSGDRTGAGNRTGGDGRPHRAEGAAAALAGLFRLMEMSDLRFNGQMHLPVNLLTLWDVHVLLGMERWKGRHGPSLRGWMEALGRVDALSALAGLAHGHPDWVFPEVGRGGSMTLEAEGLGHPLLDPGAAVRNDVEIGPPGTLLLVTGSNMSGKSTLLRAVGANVVLAGAGGPVCADAMSFPAVDLRTSMRIRDSLEGGISYFMAELRRLKTVAEAASAAKDVPVLYLLDEMLQGTNTAERQIAARRILRHLLDEEAIGAVTTHDLTLADAPDLRERAVFVHFRESLEERDGGPPITFEYRLRPGIATSTNALRLMEIMGFAKADADAL